MEKPGAELCVKPVWAGCALLLATVLLAGVGTGQAAVALRASDMETGASPPFDFDQITTLCPTSAVMRETNLAYSGAASLKVHTESDPTCEGPHARGVIQKNAPNHLAEGDDFSLEAAIYLPNGFYEAHMGYTDLIRVDSYVRDDSTTTAFENRAEINFASWDNDELHVRAARGSDSTNLIGPLSPSAMPEGIWNLIQLHVRLSSTDGVALTELTINDSRLGSSTSANLFVDAEPLNRLRFGIVSATSSGSGDLTAYFDRVAIRDSGDTTPEQPPAQAPDPEPVSEPEIPNLSEILQEDPLNPLEEPPAPANEVGPGPPPQEAEEPAATAPAPAHGDRTLEPAPGRPTARHGLNTEVPWQQVATFMSSAVESVPRMFRLRITKRGSCAKSSTRPRRKRVRQRLSRHLRTGAHRARCPKRSR